MVILTPSQLLALTPKAIARAYRSLVLFVRTLPQSEQWHYGTAVKQYEAAYIVALETK